MKELELATTLARLAREYGVAYRIYPNVRLRELALELKDAANSYLEFVERTDGQPNHSA